MKYIKFVVFTAVLFYLSYFASFNVGKIQLRFLDESLLGAGYKPLVLNLPFFVYLFIAVLGTMIIMSALGIIERTALRLKVKKFEKENRKLKAELETVKGVGVPSDRKAAEGGAESPKKSGREKRTPTEKKNAGESKKEGAGEK
jgi:hypothetical protein